MSLIKPPYNPTRKQIAKATAEIRAGWDPEETIRRRHGISGRRPKESEREQRVGRFGDDLELDRGEFPSER